MVDAGIKKNKHQHRRQATMKNLPVAEVSKGLELTEASRSYHEAMKHKGTLAHLTAKARHMADNMHLLHRNKTDSKANIEPPKESKV